MKLKYFLLPHTKVNPEWLKDFTRRHNTIKLLEEKIGKTFSDIYCSNVFLGQLVSKGKRNKSKNK